MKHDLKIWPEHFVPVVEGRKTFELRIEDDRKFAVGDQLHLKEWDRVNQKYTGRDVVADVIHLLRAGDTTYLLEGVTALSIKVQGADPKYQAALLMANAVSELLPVAKRYKDEMTTFGAGTDQKIQRAEEAIAAWVKAISA